MLDALEMSIRTLSEHVGPAVWAMLVFGCGFLFAFPVVRFEVRSLLALPTWLLRLARKYLKPGISGVVLFAFIFLFNTAAILAYMVSGGLVFLPIVFDLFTGLNVGAVMLKDAEAAAEEGEERPPRALPPARAWVGFLSLFVVVVELSAFWLAIGMGMKIGRLMAAHFTWAGFLKVAEPRVVAYVVVLVPALALSALAETIAIKAMMQHGELDEA